jgi:hypothetical protein
MVSTRSMSAVRLGPVTSDMYRCPLPFELGKQQARFLQVSENPGGGQQGNAYVGQHARQAGRRRVVGQDEGAGLGYARAGEHDGCPT